MPTYDIHPLSAQIAEDGKKYFLDANVWIYVIESSNLASHQEYIDFFSKIISKAEDYDSRKKQFLASGGKERPGHFDGENRPRIILTPMLVSEMFNVLIRKRFDEWKRMNMYPNADFKRDFRWTQECIDASQHMRDELLNYKSYFEVISDDISTLDIGHILNDRNYDMDFNDQCYYLHCYDNGYILVTNDKDFKVQSIKIYTELAQLLSL